MLDKWIQTLQAGDCLAERDLKKLCLMVRARQSNAPAFLLLFFFFLCLYEYFSAVGTAAGLCALAVLVLSVTGAASRRHVQQIARGA